MKKVGYRRAASCLTGCLILSCLLLGGCSLAKEELQAAEEEELCGVLVTVGEQKARIQREEPQKVYTSLKEMEQDLWAPETAKGVRQEDDTYVFEGVEGWMLGIMEEENDGEPCIYFTSSEIFQDVHSNVNVSDEGETCSIEATVKVAENIMEPVYINPVYRQNDGTVCVVLENGGYLLSGVREEGKVYAQALKYETSETANGRSEKRSREFKVNIAVGSAVKTACAVEMSEENQQLKRTALTREMTELTLQPQTAYVMVEEELENGELERSVYTWNEEKAGEGLLFHTIDYAGKDGLLVPSMLTFIK